MKKIIFFLALGVCTFTANSQNLVASWDFDDNLGAVSNPVYVTYAGSASVSSGVNNLGYQPGCNFPLNPDDKQLVLGGFPSSGIMFDLTKYVEIYFVAAKDFFLTNLQFRTKRTFDGPHHWEIRKPPYTFAMYSNGTASTGCVFHFIGIFSPVFAGDTVRYRFYAGDTPDIVNGTWRIDSLFFETNTSPLPVELLAFRANVVDHRVDLNWITASEKNNDYFKVERSKDLQSWEYVGEIPGAGTSSFQNEYTLTDDSPFDGTSYYRLLQYDFDGKETIFKPIEVKVSDEKTMSIIYDVLGQVVSDWSLEHPKLKPNVTYIKLYEDGKREKYVSR